MVLTPTGSVSKRSKLFWGRFLAFLVLRCASAWRGVSAGRCAVLGGVPPPPSPSRTLIASAKSKGLSASAWRGASVAFGFLAGRCAVLGGVPPPPSPSRTLIASAKSKGLSASAWRGASVGLFVSVGCCCVSGLVPALDAEFLTLEIKFFKIRSIGFNKALSSAILTRSVEFLISFFKERSRSTSFFSAQFLAIFSAWRGVSASGCSVLGDE